MRVNNANEIFSAGLTDCGVEREIRIYIITGRRQAGVSKKV